MTIDSIILAAAWIITIIILVLFIPKDKLREAQLIFLFKQAITWITGLLVVELKLLEYPVRLFSYANRTSFSFEFFIYPSLCAVFNLHYPINKGILKRFMHYFNFCSAMTIIEVLCEKYTNIIKYLDWTWYVTWITLFITFWLSRQFYLWFFRLKDPTTRT